MDLKKSLFSKLHLNTQPLLTTPTSQHQQWLPHAFPSSKVCSLFQSAPRSKSGNIIFSSDQNHPSRSVKYSDLALHVRHDLRAPLICSWVPSPGTALGPFPAQAEGPSILPHSLSQENPALPFPGCMPC